MKAKLKVENLIIYQEGVIIIENQDFNPIGRFEKKVLLITDGIADESAEQQLLDKMLQATGLGYGDVYLLKLSDKKGLWAYINKIKPEKVICFGAHLDTHSSTFSKRLYKVQYINDIQLLIVNNLSKIIDTSDAKQALWNGLKKMFNL